jgi:hypothetical protein
MNKRDLSERDICTKYITSAVVNAGWDIQWQIREEVGFTKGRIIVRGKLVTRGKAQRADYILYYKPNIPIALIEAKDNNNPVGGGMQQAIKYAATLDIPFVFSSNGDAFTSVNALQVLTNFGIGRLIVEHDQQGRYRAVYGKEALVHLSASLTAEFGRGFSRANLEYMRNSISDGRIAPFRFPQKPSGKLPSAVIGQTPSGKSPAPFTLSWSHYVLLLTIKNSEERSFYEIEATHSGWSVPELKRQLNSGLYERLGRGGARNKSACLQRRGTPSPNLPSSTAPHHAPRTHPTTPPNHS